MSSCKIVIFVLFGALVCTSTINARKGSFEDEEALILGHPYPRIGASGGRAWVTLEVGSSVPKSTARNRGADIFGTKKIRPRLFIFGTKKIGPRLLWIADPALGDVNAAVNQGEGAVGGNGKR